MSDLVDLRGTRAAGLIGTAISVALHAQLNARASSSGAGCSLRTNGTPAARSDGKEDRPRRRQGAEDTGRDNGTADVSGVQFLSSTHVLPPPLFR